ncbi:SPFH domain-containing protein [Massilibacteroides sp.]|uniref:SPFH domain-containing protein n=1 Tax=Massilibacteroides sp. TaxID=2034766 RepID=UPI00262E585A|nr:SPFH domain-containing protein [Massilibacteroides sp.]MDD4513953.1 SPFH domain-containing protein [Massilibacteroides sp.]
MGIWDKLKGELIDIVEFLDNTQDTIVYRFERHNNEIKNNAKLVVRESQMAVFVNEGQIADTFTPGTYTLNTQNLPILSTLKGWKYGFNSPFKAEVYFVNTKNFIDQKWGTKNAIILNDSRFGMVEIRAFGMYSFKITDAPVFIREIVGTNQSFTTANIQEQLKSIIVTRFSDAVGETNLPIENYASNLNELSEAIFGYMQDDFTAYGMDVTKFLIENISMPDEIKKEIFELSRLERIDLDKLMKLKAAKAMEASAENPSGTAGMGMGLGAGMAMASQMTQAMTNQMQATNQNTQATPPPIPGVGNYYVAIDGKQQGPHDKAKLAELVVSQQLTRETLVWKQGLAGWEQAGDQADLQDLFAATPPPLPKQD